MTEATQTTEVSTTATATVAAPAAVVVPKAPSLKSRADAIFAAALEARREGKFESNKAFRAHVLSTIVSALGVTIASAATMYNSAKKAAETADATVVLGRDPKVVKEKTGNGKRGRPVGSKNRPKEEVAATTETPAATEGTLIGNIPAETTEAAPAAAEALA